MNKLTMQSCDVVGGNVAKIAAMFPQCVTERKNTEGKVERAIDFEKLKAELSDDVIEVGEERYQFTWPDKRAAARLANTPTTMTLRPCREQSVGRDGTPGGFDSENLYIEGDNLDVLKVLRETYLGKVKMIYIDPPYNTGNDFVYNDDFVQDYADYRRDAINSARDEDGNLTRDPMVRNTEANGRFHTDWLNMIYPRLKVARDFLAEDGVIFISIDDSEQDNLRKVCDEIFGGRNFVAQLIWERAYSPKNDARFISNSHDYIIMYAKDIDTFKIGRLERTEEANARYSNPDNDSRGPWKPSDMSVKTYNSESDYPITTPSGRIVEPPAGRCWSLSAKAFAERLSDNRIWFGMDGNSVPCIKRFLSELKFEGMAPTSILYYKDVGHSQEGAKEVTALFGDKGVFDGPKPVRLLERLLTLANLKEDSIILDFFSGSATTAHALLKRNADKGSRCNFILVQLPEVISDTKKDQGYTTICEIGEERIRRAGKDLIRRAGKKIKDELINKSVLANMPNNTEVTINGLQQTLFTEDQKGEAQMDSAKMEQIAEDLDIGFRVLKLDTSNMEDVYYTPDKFDPSMLDGLVDNIKADRTNEDLLFQVMLSLGIELSAKIKRQEIAGKEVWNVDDGYLLACFDKDVNETTIEGMAKLQPTHLVIRDASAANDNVLDNFDQIIETYSAEKKITTHVV